jgi:ubiquinone/menaquinone biosynthesis C-methylase UbiE
MQRIPEPELMEDEEQVEAYSAADFAESHQLRVTWFRERFGLDVQVDSILDLGCGSGDMTFRFARALPDSQLLGVDGSQAMLEVAGRLLKAEPALDGRIQFLRANLPADPLPATGYDMVMCHSALHHFHDAQVLWETIRRHSRPGSLIFVSDLRRPESQEAAERIVQERAGNEHPVLQRDFTASLCAAFTPEEVVEQLRTAGLNGLSVEAIGDIYLLVYGTVRSGE